MTCRRIECGREREWGGIQDDSKVLGQRKWEHRIAQEGSLWEEQDGGWAVEAQNWSMIMVDSFSKKKGLLCTSILSLVSENKIGNYVKVIC